METDMNDWSCLKCTFMNKSSNRRCEVCKTRCEATSKDLTPLSSKKATPIRRQSSSSTVSSKSSEQTPQTIVMSPNGSFESSSKETSIFDEPEKSSKCISTNKKKAAAPQKSSLKRTGATLAVSSSSNDIQKVAEKAKEYLPLKGVCAFIDVKIESKVPASKELSKHLVAMGAKVLSRFNIQGLTHLIFYKGDIARALRARQDYNVAVVQQAWVEECRKQGRVSETPHLVELDTHAADESKCRKVDKNVLEPDVDFLFRTSSDPAFSSSQADTPPQLMAISRVSRHRNKNIDSIDEADGTIPEDSEAFYTVEDSADHPVRSQEEEEMFESCETTSLQDDHPDSKVDGKNINPNRMIDDIKELPPSSSHSSSYAETKPHAEVFQKTYASSNSKTSTKKRMMGETNPSTEVGNATEDISSKEEKDGDTCLSSAKKKRPSPKDTCLPSRLSSSVVGFSGFEAGEKATLSSILRKSMRISDQTCDKVTHLIVNTGASNQPKRTFRVIFALLHQAHILRPDFVLSTLDQSWPSEKEFYAKKKNENNGSNCEDWSPNEKRNSILKGRKVYIDSKAKFDDELQHNLVLILGLCGAEVVQHRSTCDMMISKAEMKEQDHQPLKVKQVKPKKLRKDDSVEVEAVTIPHLFDMIELKVREQNIKK